MKTDNYGRQMKEVVGPLRIKAAKRDGTGNDGGVLDRGIVAKMEDGTECVIGELWAMGPDNNGARISLDSIGNAERIVERFNAAQDEALSPEMREELSAEMGLMLFDGSFTYGQIIQGIFDRRAELLRAGTRTGGVVAEALS